MKCWFGLEREREREEERNYFLFTFRCECECECVRNAKHEITKQLWRERNKKKTKNQNNNVFCTFIHSCRVSLWGNEVNLRKTKTKTKIYRKSPIHCIVAFLLFDIVHQHRASSIVRRRVIVIRRSRIYATLWQQKLLTRILFRFAVDFVCAIANPSRSLSSVQIHGHIDMYSQTWSQIVY